MSTEPINHIQLIGPIAEHLSKELQMEGVILHWNSEETTTPESSPFKDMTAEELARRMDHTLLKPDATETDIEAVCAQAVKHNFASVCVNGTHVARVAKQLKGSQVKTVAVVGFPLGASTSEVKFFEARQALDQGAQEIDMVVNLGALKSKRYAQVLNDIRGVSEACGPRKLKVILEMGALTQSQKVEGCLIAKAAGASFVKTSTGFNYGGATIEDVLLMREVVGHSVSIKASGGIKTREQAIALLEAGADRLGTSASVAIVTGRTGGDGY